MVDSTIYLLLHRQHSPFKLFFLQNITSNLPNGNDYQWVIPLYPYPIRYNMEVKQIPLSDNTERKLPA